MRSKAIIVLFSLILCFESADAVEFKLGDFNITMNPPETVDHISYSSDTYDDFEINKANFDTLASSYTVTILKSFSKPAEVFKSTIFAYDTLLNITVDGKPAIETLFNQYTTVEYLKDDKTLITLEFEEDEGTDSSNSIAATIKSFRATTAALQTVPLITEPYNPYNATMGKYAVSFDMGSNDFYATVGPWKASESLSGNENYEFGSISINNHNMDDRIAIISVKHSDKDQPNSNPSEFAASFKEQSGWDATTRTIDGVLGIIASQEDKGITTYIAQYKPAFDPKKLNVSIMSTYPWDEGTLSLLKTIHVEKINETSQ